MKNAIILSLVIGGVALTSCKKQYTCECEVTQTTSFLGETDVSVSNTTYTAELKKNEAEEWCEGHNKTVPSFSFFGENHYRIRL